MTPFKELKAIVKQLEDWGYEPAEWLSNPIEQVAANDSIHPVHTCLSIHTLNYFRKEYGKTVLITWPRDGKKWTDKFGNKHSVTIYYPFYTEDGYGRIQYHCPYGALACAKNPYNEQDDLGQDIYYAWPAGASTLFDQYVSN